MISAPPCLSEPPVLDIALKVIFKWEQLLKAQKSAEKKVKSMQEDMDGDELQSKEDKAALKKLRDAKAAADEAITFAKLLERVKGGRDLKAMTYSPRSLLERHKADPLDLIRAYDTNFDGMLSKVRG